MDNSELLKQKQLLQEKLIELEQSNNRKYKDIYVLLLYVQSLIEPEKFTDNEKEDLRKLALEFGYDVSKNFETWYKIFINNVLN